MPPESKAPIFLRSGQTQAQGTHARPSRNGYGGRAICTGGGDAVPIQTRLTELLSVHHPILLAPMDLVSDGRLAAAVSRAGGFGILGGGYGNEAWLVREMDAAGDARIGI